MSQNRPQRALEDQPALWSNLPRKGQLCILAFCRVYDFMQVASFQTVCYYQLKSFDPSLPEETLSWQTGMAGRKRVLLIGLLGTGLFCIELAFSRSFLTVIPFRLLVGASNGTVGIM